MKKKCRLKKNIPRFVHSFSLRHPGIANDNFEQAFPIFLLFFLVLLVNRALKVRVSEKVFLPNIISPISSLEKFPSCHSFLGTLLRD